MNNINIDPITHRYPEIGDIFMDKDNAFHLHELKGVVRIVMF